MAPLPGLPDTVEIWEMSPRDGLQAERARLGVEERVELIERLAAAGCAIIEAGSFVRSDRVPAMAGSDEVLRRVAHLPVRTPVLVPNLRGYELARAAGAQEVAVFLSVTESFSQSNLGASRETMEAAAADVVSQAARDGVRVRGYLSMAFGDPWEGTVPPREVLGLAQRMRAFGVQALSLGDTIGVATPGQVTDVLRTLTGEGIPVGDIALHMHDTYGQALANVSAGLAAGVRVFDASAAGIGGCPFARSATGNLATDDLLWMLAGLGIHTGIDLDALTETGAWLSAALDKPPTSRVAMALAR
ncbi:hydroxymethylglutaryl-CoA lyase [Leucobacter aridicollis]|nr:hydroxymethylglutaryl-CoA lyase [Leucobacter aridicollis]